ncbi:MAG: SPOR domain-containing protein [Flavobacteriales bacterium]
MNKIIIFIFLLTSYCLSAQTDTDETNIANTTTVKVIKDNRIDDMVQTYKSSYTLNGYRIQIFSDNKKQPAREEKARFLSSFNSVKAHEVYQQPYFKIRVGDFRTKLEAYKFQKEIQLQFPNCFIVKDEIEVEQLLKNE